MINNWLCEVVQAKPAPVITEHHKIEVDKTPPKIIITEPDLTGAMSVVAEKMGMILTGIAESKIGIMYVLINGKDVELDDKGNFLAVVPLKRGQNTVTVIAADISKNKSIKEFVVNREAGKVVVANREE
ncbi:MAG: hypothetical protein ACXWMS_09515, partial [Syntrophales bacterium]